MNATPNLPDADYANEKEVKLHLPIRTHVQLHTAKLLRNTTIQASILAAVAAYFERHPVDPMSA